MIRNRSKRHLCCAALAIVLGAGSAAVQAGAYKITDPGYWPWANLALTGSTSGSWGGHAGMIDGDVGRCTPHQAGTSDLYWYETFATPVTVDLLRLYHMWGRPFDAWELAYDSDPGAGQTWTPLASGTGSIAGRRENYLSTVTTQGFRLWVDPGTNIDPRGRELELYSRATGMPLAIINGDVTSHAVSSAAKGTSGVLLDNLIDGSSGWQPATVASGGNVEWARYLFAEARPLNGMRIMTEDGTCPSSVALQYLRIGGDPAVDADWLAYGTVSGLGTSWGTVWFHEAADSYFHSRGLRIYMAGNTNGGSWFRLAEIEIYGLPEPGSGLLLAGLAALVLRRRRG